MRKNDTLTGSRNEDRTAAAGHAPERTCILTRRAAPKGELIRLALGPDGVVLPDLRARAPGRGAYIGVDRAALEEAMAKGKLKGALARAFKDGKATAPDDLPQRIADGLERLLLDRLGLEARGGMLVTGSERCETACRKGQGHLLLHACDAGADGKRSLAQAFRVGRDDEGSGAQGLVLPLDRPTLSGALGRENVVHIVLTDAKAARRVSAALSRWHAFLGADAGVEGSATMPPAAPAPDAPAPDDPGNKDVKTKEL